ncbi:MAG: methyl-accepting chemotaxis protein, partial [Solirubrobacterales bacterium]|jgi:hypothetical protein|nr:methyl-accepting chemotaxis protein [Solirubrobacterales bacterium]
MNIRNARASLGLKLGGLSVLLLAFMAVVVAVAALSLSKVADNGHQMYTSSVRPLNALSDARGTFNFSRALVFKHILDRDPAVKQTMQTTIDDNIKAIKASLGEVRAGLSTPAGRQAYDRLDAAFGAPGRGAAARRGAGVPHHPFDPRRRAQRHRPPDVADPP